MPTTHLVVIVQDDKPAESQVPPQGTRLGRNPLLQAPVAADDVREVVDNLCGMDKRTNNRKKHADGDGVGI